nr:MAG TPA: PROTEIN/RNA Complex, archaeal, ribosomal, 50S, protein.0A [Caudoviricetes sp.]
MICYKCGNPGIKEEDNFCVACGVKLKNTCNCWVIKKENYNCGESSCPGYKILTKRSISNETQSWR